MLRVRDGDALAFEQLVGRYQNRLMTVLTHLVGRRDLAEDLVQDVFLRVYRARARYEPRAKFSTWLFTIANNVASNALRGLSRRKEVHLDAGASGPLGARPFESLVQEASGQMPSRKIDQAELHGVIRASLDALGDRQRLAVLLNKFEHMSYAEIGETMDLSPPAVKSLLARARTALRDVLSPYLAEGTAPSTGLGEDTTLDEGDVGLGSTEGLAPDEEA